LESLFFFSENRFLLARRPSQGLMAGMWELPAQAADDFIPWPDFFEDGPELLGRVATPFQHRFTHLHAFYHITVLRHSDQTPWRKPPTAYSETRWIGKEDFAHLPVTRVLLKMLPELTRYLEGQCPPKDSRLPGMSTTT
jgi:adenine-specific DNA glycosylase